jgi:hypothetical protein
MILRFKIGYFAYLYAYNRDRVTVVCLFAYMFYFYPTILSQECILIVDFFEFPIVNTCSDKHYYEFHDFLLVIIITRPLFRVITGVDNNQVI